MRTVPPDDVYIPSTLAPEENTMAPEQSTMAPEESTMNPGDLSTSAETEAPKVLLILNN